MRLLALAYHLFRQRRLKYSGKSGLSKSLTTQVTFLLSEVMEQQRLVEVQHNTPNISLRASGSGTFLGDVAIGDSTTFRDNAAIIAALPEAIRETFKSALSKWEKATPYAPEDPSTLPADETLEKQSSALRLKLI